MGDRSRNKDGDERGTTRDNGPDNYDTEDDSEEDKAPQAPVQNELGSGTLNRVMTIQNIMGRPYQEPLTISAWEAVREAEESAETPDGEGGGGSGERVTVGYWERRGRRLAMKGTERAARLFNHEP